MVRSNTRKSPRAQAKQQRSVERREEILAGLGSAIDDLGFEKVTIHDIIDRAQCSAGAFYRYFVDKADATNSLRAIHADLVYAAVAASLDRVVYAAVAAPLGEVGNGVVSLKDNLRRLHAAMVLIHADQPGMARLPFDSGRLIGPLVDLFYPYTQLDKVTLETKVIVACGLSAAMAKSAIEHFTLADKIDDAALSLLDELAGDA